MNTIAIGDLTVNRLGFGAMRVCGPQVWGPLAARIACKKVYSEQNFEKTLSQAVKQVKDFEIGIVAINIDDVTPADTVLNVRNHQEMNRKLQGLCEGFLQRHERHLRKYLSKERLVAALISIHVVADVRARRARFLQSRGFSYDTIRSVLGLSDSTNFSAG